MNFFKFINLIKLTIFGNLIIIGKKLRIYPTYLHPFYLTNNKPIILIDKNKNQTLNEGRNYLDKCLNLVDNNTYNTFIQIFIRQKVLIYISNYI